MSDFTISCDAFQRLASIVEHYKPHQQRAECVSVCIMNRGGRVIGQATNSKIAAYEYLNVTDQPDGQVLVVIDPALVEQCKTEVPFGSFLTIQTNDALQFATAKTTLGYSYPDNAAIWNANPGNLHSFLFDKLHTEHKTLKKSRGAMHWYLDSLARLAGSAPSGRIVFPEFIDTELPVILRDPISENWFGAFIPDMNDRDKGATKLVPATLPDWFGA